MTKDEVFAQLKEAFGLDSVLKQYRSLEPFEGLKEAISYWDWAKSSKNQNLQSNGTTKMRKRWPTF